MGELAGWLSLARRRSYQPSIHNKYHKYTLPLTVGEQPQEELTEALKEDLQDSEYQQDQNVHDPSPQEISLKERLKNATELDVMSKISWNTLASVHRTEHTLDSDETSEDNINAVGITEVQIFFREKKQWAKENNAWFVAGSIEEVTKWQDFRILRKRMKKYVTRVLVICR